MAGTLPRDYRLQATAADLESQSHEVFPEACGLESEACLGRILYRLNALDRVKCAGILMVTIRNTSDSISRKISGP